MVRKKNTNRINTNIIFFWVIYNKIKTHDRDILEDYFLKIK